jgi:hypothetical protein
MAWFHNPATGAVWATVGEPSQAVRAAYGPGTVEIPARPAPGHAWNGSAWVAAEAPDPLPASVTPVQWRLALILASEPADPGDPDGPARVPWAKGQDLPTLVAACLATLPPLEQAVAAARLDYGSRIVSADILAYFGEGEIVGVTAGMVEELIRFAASLNPDAL